MQQISDEVRRRPAPPAPPNGSTKPASPAGGPLLPPALSISPLKADQPERYAQISERARERTEVNRLIPKFLRGLFRKQGGFNQEILSLAKFLMQETRETKKRLREIATYLQAENGWLSGVLNTFAQVNWTLQARLENQQSFERRLLDLNDRMAQFKADSLRKEQELSESLKSISAELAKEGITRARLLADWEAKISAAADVRTKLKDQIDAVHQRLEEVVSGHERLDALQQDLATRADQDASLLTSLGEAVVAARTQNDETRDKLRVAMAALTSMQGALTIMEARQFEEGSYLKRELHLHSQSLGALKDTPPPSRESKRSPSSPSTSPEIDEHRFDGFYLAFENRFRGSRADIKDRVRVYLPLLKKARLGKRKAPVLDLGCGRGEWLELLRDEGFIGRGVDLNLFMVGECLQRKLEVTQGDVIDHLATLASNSQGAVTAFHLIEHLPFATLMQLFAETLRILRPSGICVFETPNPDNVQVGSNRFYSDPTHLRPLPNELTRFLLDSIGFKRLEILPLHPDANAVALTDEAEAFERFTHQMFFGAQDYAVIGRK